MQRYKSKPGPERMSHYGCVTSPDIFLHSLLLERKGEMSVLMKAGQAHLTIQPKLPL